MIDFGKINRAGELIMNQVDAGTTSMAEDPPGRRAGVRRRAFGGGAAETGARQA
jgi:hypothetical protein